MEMIRTVREMQQRAMVVRQKGRRIGFVPTMGCLHEGHLSLVKLARARADLVVLSIFVNPIQFLPGEDFSRYPRPVESDVALCQAAGVDILFYPDNNQIYAPDHSVTLSETLLSRGLCGASRPGHFNGVATVVAKLFNMVLPDFAVFGQKDAQQLRVVQRMIRDLNFPVEIITGPIVREADGLAMSSRNRYLTPEERQDALCLHQSLEHVESRVREGARDVETLRKELAERLSRVPSARVEYIEFVDNEKMCPVARVEGVVLVALAIRIGSTRLIDNTVLGS
ncbi:MAG: pantoate--beta-alanine ligase [bacterium]